MATNPNMVAIETVTVPSGGAAEIEFTNIPATFTDLIVKASLRTDNASTLDAVGVSFNSNTSNYYYNRIRGNGTNVTASSDGPLSSVDLGYATGDTATASTFGNLEFYIPNYAGSTYKSFSSDGVSENNATEAYTGLWAGLWSNTSAITSIKLVPQTGTEFNEHSTATLYGIKNS